MFKLEVNKSIIKVVEREPIASGGSKIYSVEFLFDDEWEGLVKSAVFKAGEISVEVLLETESIEMPFEVLCAENIGKALWVGVLGSDETGVRLPAIWNQLGVIRAGTERGKKAKKAEADALAKVVGLAREAQASAVSAEKEAGESASAAKNAEASASSARLYAETTAELASGILKVDIKAEKTDFGANITVTDRTGAENTVEINPLGEAKEAFSNVLRGKAAGTLVSLSDVSPVEHNIRVEVSADEGTDLSSVKLYRYGKNLLKYPYVNGQFITKNGLTFSDAGEGKVSVSGTTTAQTNFHFAQPYGHTFKKGQKYTFSLGNEFSCIASDTGAIGYIYSPTKGTLCSISLATANKKTFTPSADVSDANIYLLLVRNVTINGLLKPMLTIGSDADFEPYSVSEYTVNPDGTVDGIKSLSPAMTLMTDMDGAAIHCTYNRDINKAFEAITNAIISMGGNI